ncbi:MAG: hypothetical protein KY462_02820 [Actinobacteria bacterium]|nr:hypothetical protein [Actinomycetota bacterium]
MTGRWLLAVAVLGLALVGAACGEPADAPELDALRADPMASYQGQDLTLVDRSLSAGGRTLGKPVRASVVQRYAIADSADPEAVRAAAIAAAEAAGWTFFAEGPIASANKRIAGSQATLSIEVREEQGQAFLTVVLLEEAGE